MDVEGKDDGEEEEEEQEERKNTLSTQLKNKKQTQNLLLCLCDVFQALINSLVC